jgi:flavin-dependent dehydrogenase
MNEYGNAIVGAGISGAIIARFAASSRLNMCWIDALKKERMR